MPDDARISPDLIDNSISPHTNPKNATVFRVAIAGNPNCGKTTLFNALTGLRHKVANYPGVTVEKKEGSLTLPNGQQVLLIDLPGIYTLFGNSVDESIASSALLGQISNEPVPDLVISVVDASNLERNLYLTTQLLDLGLPIIVALNMLDIAEKRGLSIKQEILSRFLDLKIIPIVACKQKGLDQLKHTIEQSLLNPQLSQQRAAWVPAGHQILKDCAHTAGKLLPANTDSRDLGCFLQGLALLSEATPAPTSGIQQAVLVERQRLAAAGIDSLSFEATERYRWINSLIKKSCIQSSVTKPGRGDFIDRVLTHKLWGVLVFALVMGLIFQSIFLWASIPMDWIDSSVSTFGNFLSQHLPQGQLRSLLVNGIVSGVGSVLVFIPQIAILFFFLGLLEDSGYLSRAAFLMDKVMRPVGLQGRSFIPLLSSFACAIPGIMSTRTIPSFADRMATILIAPLMSCSARLPVYTLLISAFIPRNYFLGFISLQGLVLLSMYLLGIAAAALVAFILKRSIFKGEPAIFVMEMPAFRAPQLKQVLREVMDRVLVFIKSAGTIILACSIVLWFLASYPQSQDQHSSVQHSFAGQIGQAMEPVIKPLGLNWEIGVGILASFAAREVFISSLATVYNLQDEDESSQSLVSELRQRQAAGRFSLASALSLMVFYVFACQCMSTLAVCRRETGSWRWPGFMFGYMTVLAYVAAFATYNLATLVFG